VAGTVALALSPTLLSQMAAHRTTTLPSSGAHVPTIQSTSEVNLLTNEHSTPATNPCVSCSKCAKSELSFDGTPEINILSVIKDLLGLWPLPSAHEFVKQAPLCEYGPCGYRQQGSALECFNVTAPSATCPTSPCCCCQSMPSLDDNLVTNFPHTQILGFRTEALR
jgi:hypothetical protein